MSQPDFSTMTPEQFTAWRTANDPASQPAPTLAPQDPYAVTAWGENEYDFKVPSGQLCRLKKVRPEDLIGTGILDQITRLPGFAEELVQKADGQPPKPATAVDLPAKEDMEKLLTILDELIPMVVVKPTVRREPVEGEERLPGVVYVRDIELSDRVAIMERATSGVQKFDNFRQEP